MECSEHQPTDKPSEQPAYKSLTQVWPNITVIDTRGEEMEHIDTIGAEFIKMNVLMKRKP